MNLNEKEVKRFTSLLINTRIIYWDLGDNGCDYTGRISEMISSAWTDKKSRKFFKEINEVIISHNITNQEISDFIETIDNPREKWRIRMKEHNNGGRETRDNKGTFVSCATYHEPDRWDNGNIRSCRFNKIRYPKKCRSLRTWKTFYKMFPKQAEIDNWDGKTFDKMK